MPGIALVFALTAAVLHALWNLLLARSRDVESATAVALIVAELAFAPVAAVVWRVDAGVWPWLAGSGLFEIAYFALLATAYRKAPLSVVYPIARGGAPVLVLLVGAVALGHTTSWRQALAVVFVVAGILLVRGFRGAAPAGVVFGLAIASCIAGYTLIDKRGVTYAGPIPYLELSMLGPAALYAGAVLRVKGSAAVRAAVGPATIVAGLATFGAYALVLAALQRAPAASVAAVRETSVVVAAA
ncbi:MAG TPA: DMT family transporter, partial [Gaiellaceae bacterium]|nr:DMT family transporter [Gaiellaceae bacterium]